jgi:hypothetical protein
MHGRWPKQDKMTVPYGLSITICNVHHVTYFMSKDTLFRSFWLGATFNLSTSKGLPLSPMQDRNEGKYQSPWTNHRLNNRIDNFPQPYSLKSGLQVWSHPRKRSGQSPRSMMFDLWLFHDTSGICHSLLHVGLLYRRDESTISMIKGSPKLMLSLMSNKNRRGHVLILLALTLVPKMRQQ